MEKPLKPTDKIVLFPLWLITLLPLRILYLLSDFLYFILYYLVGYRKYVVIENLKNAFPEKNDNEIVKILRQFYRYLCDYFIESIYLINMSLQECNRRYQYTNIELLQSLYKKGKSIILAISHFGNWEWANNLSNCSPYTIYGVYKPLRNKIFDRLFIHIRGKFISVPVPMKKTYRTVHTLMKNNELFALYLVGDQRPGKGDLEYWTTFLNQETPVITGMDKLARKFNFPVVFMNVNRPKRGYYKVTFEIICDEPIKVKEYTITEKYIRTVEKLILTQPELWLWSHKRFKYKPEEYKPQKGN
jgi:KDO2-lipid IV(A) lauroyltransferase